MMDIQKDIEKISSIELVTGSSFITMGLTALSLGHPLIAIACSPSIPLVASSIMSHFSMKKNLARGISRSFLSSFYNKKLFQCIDGYIEKSSHPLEIKAKFIFLSLWLEKDLYYTPASAYGNEDKLEKISQNLLHNEDTDYYMTEVFSQTGVKNDIYKEFLTKDLTTSSNIEIVNRVYEDFKKFGFLGKNFHLSSGTRFAIFSKLQNYQLTPSDIVQIKKLNKTVIQQGTTFVGLMHEQQQIYEIFIEKNPQHLAILKSFFDANLDESNISNALISKLIEKVKNHQKAINDKVYLENTLSITTQEKDIKLKKL